MEVVISQPRYLPALNYLQRLAFADRFIILDTVQRQARGHENRNKLRIPDVKWLTIPVASSSRALICDSVIQDKQWLADHRRTIEQNYMDHPHFDENILSLYYAGVEEEIELSGRYSFVLLRLVRNACDILGIHPNLMLASEIQEASGAPRDGADKLYQLCQAVGATRYISGPFGRKYGIVEAFSPSDISVAYHRFEHPVYSQPDTQDFIPYLGFLDAVFCAGVRWTANMANQPPDLETF